MTNSTITARIEVRPIPEPVSGFEWEVVLEGQLNQESRELLKDIDDIEDMDDEFLDLSDALTYAAKWTDVMRQRGVTVPVNIEEEPKPTKQKTTRLVVQTNTFGYFGRLFTEDGTEVLGLQRVELPAAVVGNEDFATIKLVFTLTDMDIAVGGQSREPDDVEPISIQP